jgi:hypothetical protein
MAPPAKDEPGAPAQPEPSAASEPTTTAAQAPTATEAQAPTATAAQAPPLAGETAEAEADEEALWAFGQTHALGSGLLGGWSMTGFGGSFATENWREAEVRREVEAGAHHTGARSAADVDPTGRGPDRT